MREIGGYIELDKYHLPMLHGSALALNCGRSCLSYLIQKKKIRKLVLPIFLCSSVMSVCRKNDVEIRFYHVDVNFKPSNLLINEDEWLYLVNYYGQLGQDYIRGIYKQYPRVILDQTQAYFDLPVKGVDTLYSCRKFFGVSDGAFLYTDIALDDNIPEDKSYDRMEFLLGRFECEASAFYERYVENNNFFETEPIKKMSKLTNNLLHGIDYNDIEKRRTDNFEYLENVLGGYNKLNLHIPKGAFMYPLYLENGDMLRKFLLRYKIYIPILWPDVFEAEEASRLEKDMALNILPIPVDQRYDINDMKLIIRKIEEYMNYKEELKEK